MQRVIVLVFVVWFTTNIAYAQGISGVIGGIRALPAVAPVSSYSFNASAIDHNGNLLVFDVIYTYPVPVPGQPSNARSMPSMKTHVTVITSDGKKLNPVEYDGSFQVIGIGAHAVYAIVTAYTATSSTVLPGGPTTATPVSAFTITRRLVALNAVAGILTASLPSLDVPLRAEVKLALATDNTAADTLSLVDMAPSPMILAPTGTATAPAVQRFAQIIKYLGGATFDTSIKPIPLQ